MSQRHSSGGGSWTTLPFQTRVLDNPVSSELRPIQDGNLLIDIFVKDRGSATTLIFFHASVTKSSTVPVLVENVLAEVAGANLISDSDPALK